MADSMKSKSAANLLLITKPLFQLSRIFGINPFTINKDGTEISETDKCNSFWYWHRIMVIFITGVYTLFQFVSVGISIRKGIPLFNLVSQSLWLSNGIISWCVTVFICLRAEKMFKIFETYVTMERRNKPLLCPIRANKFFLLLFTCYSLSAFGSISLCGFHAVQSPLNPIYPAHYIFEKPNADIESATPSVLFVYIYAVFQMIIICWKWVNFGFLEIVYCVFAKIISLSLEFVRSKLEYLLEQNKVCRMSNSQINHRI